MYEKQQNCEKQINHITTKLHGRDGWRVTAINLNYLQNQFQNFCLISIIYFSKFMTIMPK